MNGDKETVEVEISLRDAMSAGLKEIVKELDAQNKKIREVAGIGSKGFKDLADDIGKGTKQTKQSTASFDLIGSALKSLTTGAMAPVGIVAGVAAAGLAVADSVKHFAQTNMSFHNMAINAHVTTEQFSILTQALRRGGFSVEDSRKTTTEALKAVQNLGAYGRSGQTWKQLAEAGVPETTLNEALKFAQAGDNYQSLLTMLKRFHVAGIQEKHKIAAAYHTDIAHFEEFILGIPQHEKEIIPPMEESQIITDWMTDRTTEIGNVFGAVGEQLSEVLVASFNVLAKLLEDIADPSWAHKLRAAFSLANLGPMVLWELISGGTGEKQVSVPGLAGGGIVYSPTTIVAGEGNRAEAIIPLRIWEQVGQRAQNLMQIIDVQGGGIGQGSSIPMLLQVLRNVLRSEINLAASGRQAQVAVVNQFHETNVNMITPGVLLGLLGGGGGARRSAGGGGFTDYAAVRDLLDAQRLEQVERSNTTTLSDIVGTLQRMENPLGPKKMALGGEVDRPTQAIVGDVPEFVNGRLVTNPIKVTLPAGSSVVPAGSDSGRLPIPRAYQNPGDIKWGPWAQAHGAIGRGTRGGHAVFASLEEGRGALEELLVERGAMSKPLSETNKWYAEDPKWAAGISKIMGTSPRDIPTDVHELSGAIMRQEGFFKDEPRKTPKNHINLEINFAGLNLNRVAPDPTFKKTKSLIQPSQGAVAGAQPSWRE